MLALHADAAVLTDVQDEMQRYAEVLVAHERATWLQRQQAKQVATERLETELENAVSAISADRDKQQQVLADLQQRLQRVHQEKDSAEVAQAAQAAQTAAQLAQLSHQLESLRSQREHDKHSQASAARAVEDSKHAVAHLEEALSVAKQEAASSAEMLRSQTRDLMLARNKIDELERYGAIWRCACASVERPFTCHAAAVVAVAVAVAVADVANTATRPPHTNPWQRKRKRARKPSPSWRKPRRRFWSW